MSDTPALRIIIKRAVNSDGTCAMEAKGCMPYALWQMIEAKLLSVDENAPFTAVKRPDGSIVVEIKAE